MACGIYKITNLINGKSYIGQSIDIEGRWHNEKNRAFRPSYEHYDKTLFRAFRKYGLQNFQFEIIEECEELELDEKEKYYIALYDTYYSGYNETLGGNNGNQGNCIKISKEQLLEIYDLLQNSTITQREIAERYSVGQDVISMINHGKSKRMPGYEYPLRSNRTIQKYCVDCGKVISLNATRCDACQKLQSRVCERPTRDELKQLIRTLPFTQIGKQFGVTDNSIRKWCVFYDLPQTKKAINAYSDEEWALI